MTKLKSENDTRYWIFDQNSRDILTRIAYIRGFLNSFPKAEKNFDELSYKHINCNFQSVLNTELWMSNLYNLLTQALKTNYDESGTDINSFLTSLSIADDLSRQIRDNLWKTFQQIDMLETFRVPPSLLSDIGQSECQADLQALKVLGCQKHNKGVSCLGLSFQEGSEIKAFFLSPIFYPKFHVDFEPNHVAVFKKAVWDKTLDLSQCSKLDTLIYECSFITSVPNSCFAAAELTTASVNDIHRNCRIKTNNIPGVIIEHFQDSTLIHGNTKKIKLDIPGLDQWDHFPVIFPPSVEFSLTQDGQKLTFSRNAINEYPQVSTTSFSEAEILRLSDGSTSTPSWLETLKFFQWLIPTEMTSFGIFALVILTGILYLLDCGQLVRKLFNGLPKTHAEAMSMLGQGLCWLCRLPNRGASSARSMWQTMHDLNNILQGRRAT